MLLLVWAVWLVHNVGGEVPNMVASAFNSSKPCVGYQFKLNLAKHRCFNSVRVECHPNKPVNERTICTPEECKAKCLEDDDCWFVSISNSTNENRKLSCVKPHENSQFCEPYESSIHNVYEKVCKPPVCKKPPIPPPDGQIADCIHKTHDEQCVVTCKQYFEIPEYIPSEDHKVRCAFDKKTGYANFTATKAQCVSMGTDLYSIILGFSLLGILACSSLITFKCINYKQVMEYQNNGQHLSTHQSEAGVLLEPTNPGRSQTPTLELAINTSV